jgi:N-acetylmuramoyl-L-alanine amidase
MINPTELEWRTDPQAQEQLAVTIAEGIEFWWTNKQESLNAKSSQR